jgi:hypothetical protein
MATPYLEVKEDRDQKTRELDLAAVGERGACLEIVKGVASRYQYSACVNLVMLELMAHIRARGDCEV